MEDLKTSLSKYTNITKRLNEINAVANKIRDERRLVELDLAALYAHQKEPLPGRIELKNSEMIFNVKKPGEWKKGWTMSKKQLNEYVMEILPEHGQELMDEILRRHEAKMVGDDFQFELKPIT